MNKALTLLLASALAVTACSTHENDKPNANGKKKDLTGFIKSKSAEQQTAERKTETPSVAQNDPVSADKAIAGVYYSCEGINAFHLVTEDSNGARDTSTLFFPAAAEDTSVYNAAITESPEAVTANISVEHLENGNDVLTITKGEKTFTAVGKFIRGFTFPKKTALLQEYQGNLAVNPKVPASCKSPATGHEAFTAQVQ